MGNMLRMLDKTILWLYESFSHWIQLETGTTCFWLARLCGFGLLLDAGLLLLIGSEYPLIQFVLFITAIQSFFLFVCIFIVTTTQERTFGRSGAVMNSWRKEWSMRLLIATMIIMAQFLIRGPGTMKDIILNVDAMWIISFLYFFPCPPLPPGTKKAARENGMMKAVPIRTR